MSPTLNMTNRYTAAAVILAGIVIMAPMVYALHLRGTPGIKPMPPIPDEPALRKQVFFDYLKPVVQVANAGIREDRRLYQALAADAEHSWYERLRWRYLTRRYRVDELSSRREQAMALDRRIHEVPTSLVLAQAAKESAWGRSRFAREGNALFGERCFSKGCGMVPRRRSAKASYEVESFAHHIDSVESYMLNLNTHPRYAALRQERQRLKRAGSPVTGLALVPFTTAYSERGEAYSDELGSLIRTNRLEESP